MFVLKRQLTSHVRLMSYITWHLSPQMARHMYVSHDTSLPLPLFTQFFFRSFSFTFCCVLHHLALKDKTCSIYYFFDSTSSQICNRIAQDFTGMWCIWCSGAMCSLQLFDLVRLGRYDSIVVYLGIEICWLYFKYSHHISKVMSVY